MTGTRERARVVAIVQARMGSTRLPGKVLEPALGKPMIQHLLERLDRCRTLDEVVLATSTSSGDDLLADRVGGLGYRVERGNETDVLDRYVQAARACGADVIVRITGDCPLIDPATVDLVVNAFGAAPVDYAGNVQQRTYPDGLDAEAFSTAALETAWDEATDPYDREHVTPYLLRSDSIRRLDVLQGEDMSAERWTLDEPADLEVIRAVFDHFGHNEFGLPEIVALRNINPELFAANRGRQSIS